jgi:hypothetical protein
MRVGQAVKAIISRRSRRVTCGRCGASHPVIYDGQQCLICGAMIGAAPVNIPPALDTEKSENNRAAGHYKTELAELKLECEELRAALQAARTRPDPVRLSDFERYVQLRGWPNVSHIRCQRRSRRPRPSTWSWRALPLMQRDSGNPPQPKQETPRMASRPKGLSTRKPANRQPFDECLGCR